MKMRNILFVGIVMLFNTACTTPAAKKDDPHFAPVYAPAITGGKSSSGSLYNPVMTPSLFEDYRARRIGDVITVILDEEMKSSKQAKTNIKKEDTNAMRAAASLFGLSASNRETVDTSVARDFKGESGSDQSNSLNGSITVTVADVLPNGVLQVRGEKWITLNQGEEFIRVEGLIRPWDIRPDNTVQSRRLADAKITYSGVGQAADANRMGWISRVFVSPVWPF